MGTTIESSWENRCFMEEIESLRTNLAACQKRLEVDPRHRIDGIEARDTTIRLQDAEIKRLRRIIKGHGDDLSDAARYQFVKHMSPKKFLVLQTRCLRESLSFDDAVDGAMKNV